MATTKVTELSNFADLIWNVAEDLHGVFNEDQYGEIILPFALLRRLEAALQPTRDAVCEKYQLACESGLLAESQYSSLLMKAARAPFFNTTRFTLGTIGASNTLSDMEAYLSGFSSNVKEIFEKLTFLNLCKQLQDTDLLYITVQHFKAIDLSPENVPARAMSNIYEHLIWKFAATKHKQSKEFLTPRDVVRLATTIVLDSDDKLLTSDKGLIRTIYDPTCGSCGFINDAMELIGDYAETHGVKHPPMLLPFGQDSTPSAWALGKTMMLLRSMQDYDGSSSDVPMDKSVGIARGNTLTDDLHADKEFDYVFSNPPFGMDWGKDYNQVSKDPRFATVGLPPKSDGSMLFLTHVAKKLKKTGRGAIVLSGSPLFSGDAGSGCSEIRRWLFEKDFVEAIIQLPGSLFYNTPIQTYLWILSHSKPAYKRGKVQLVDASEFKTLIRNIGKKRFVISEEDIKRIARVVADYKDSDISRVVDYHDFGYRAVTVLRPLRQKIIITEEGIAQLAGLKSLQKLTVDERSLLAQALRALGSKPVGIGAIEGVAADLKGKSVKIGKPGVKEICKLFGVPDPEAEPCLDDKGNPIADTNLTQTEIIPLGTSLDEYMNKEVLPFAPDSYIDTTVRDPSDGEIGKVGYEVSFNKYFYKYEQICTPEEIAKEIIELEEQTAEMMRGLFR